jgi:serine/threonine-protein kinase RsbW
VQDEPADVTLNVPALPSSVAIVRAVTAGVASRMALSYESVDDLRIAVAEACNRLFALPDPRQLRVELAPGREALRVVLSTEGGSGAWPRDDHDASLAWKVIEGLTDGAVESLVAGRPTITLEIRTVTTSGA